MFVRLARDSQADSSSSVVHMRIEFWTGEHRCVWGITCTFLSFNDSLTVPQMLGAGGEIAETGSDVAVSASVFAASLSLSISMVSDSVAGGAVSRDSSGWQVTGEEERAITRMSKQSSNIGDCILAALKRWGVRGCWERGGKHHHRQPEPRQVELGKQYQDKQCHGKTNHGKQYLVKAQGQLYSSRSHGKCLVAPVTGTMEK